MFEKLKFCLSIGGPTRKPEYVPLLIRLGNMFVRFSFETWTRLVHSFMSFVLVYGFFSCKKVCIKFSNYFGSAEIWVPDFIASY